jgi:hypothetical protein
MLDKRREVTRPRCSIVLLSFCVDVSSLAVPSPSSPSSSSSWPSSDSWRAARRLIVPAEGVVELEETFRDLDRRYHSSGTQNLKDRVAEGPNGLAVKWNCKSSWMLAVPGILVDSDHGSMEK